MSVREASRFAIIANGTTEAVAEIAEELCWLATAFAPSPVDKGITYYKPTIDQLPKSEAPATADSVIFNFAIHWHAVELSPSQNNSNCWNDLFQNPVVVFGYPILKRHHSQTGLEIPLNVMATLLNEKRVNIFQNRIYIKGFNAMLVPIKRFENLLIWHLFVNKDGSHISYLNNKLVETDEHINIVDLEVHRHIVGWCSNATYHAGK